MSMWVRVSKLEKIISLGGWQMDDLCVHADLDDVKADPRITGRDLHPTECTLVVFE